MKATSIYRHQNTALHKAFATLGMPYSDPGSRGEWIELMSDITRREVTGLSDLTLGERSDLIRYLAEKHPLLLLSGPGMTKQQKGWKKGDKDTGGRDFLPFRNSPEKGKRKMLAKISAILAEIEKPWAYADGMAFRMFGVEKLEWCTPDQTHKIVSALVYHQKRRA